MCPLVRSLLLTASLFLSLSLSSTPQPHSFFSTPHLFSPQENKKDALTLIFYFYLFHFLHFIILNFVFFFRPIIVSFLSPASPFLPSSGRSLIILTIRLPRGRNYLIYFLNCFIFFFFHSILTSILVLFHISIKSVEVVRQEAIPVLLLLPG